MFMSFVRQNLSKVAIAIFLTLSFASSAFAQDLKIGVVDFPSLLERSPQSQAVLNVLETEFAPRQREFAAKANELQSLEEKIQKDAAVMGETERRNAEREHRELQREVVRLQNELQEDFNLRRNEELGKLQRTLLKQVRDYAEQQGFDLVVGEGILFASSAVNITDDVLGAISSDFQATNSN